MMVTYSLTPMAVIYPGLVRKSPVTCVKGSAFQWNIQFPPTLTRCGGQTWLQRCRKNYKTEFHNPIIESPRRQFCRCYGTYGESIFARYLEKGC